MTDEQIDEELCKPVLCVYCKLEIIPCLPEQERDAELDALTGIEIFYLHNERVCRQCFEDDERELEYRRADAA